MIHHEFSKRFKTPWVKVKFFTEPPGPSHKMGSGEMRFCEATRAAELESILLDRDHISCPGALYAFGWEDETAFIEHCRGNNTFTEETIKILLKQLPRLEQPLHSIGLNMDGEPDLIMSRLRPMEVMDLLMLYQRKTGKVLNLKLSGMMPICGGVAVASYLENTITLSFGCKDSREYGQIGKDRLMVGIPGRLFDLVAAD